MKKNFSFSLLMLGGILLVALVGPGLSSFSYDQQDVNRILLSPNFQNWLGTDELGRDVLARLMFGARVSLAVGLVTALISLVLGLLYGSFAGYKGGRWDAWMMRFLDLWNSIPSLVLLILIKSLWDGLLPWARGPVWGTFSILFGISLLSWVPMARLTRGLVLQTKQNTYVESARAMGANSAEIVWRHIIPNIWPSVWAAVLIQIPSNILWESFLSFLGLGLEPPYASWGVMAAEGWKSLQLHPHLILAPGVALFVTTLTFNFLGERKV